MVQRDDSRPGLMLDGLQSLWSQPIWEEATSSSGLESGTIWPPLALVAPEVVGCGLQPEDDFDFFIWAHADHYPWSVIIKEAPAGTAPCLMELLSGLPLHPQIPSYGPLMVSGTLRMQELAPSRVKVGDEKENLGSFSRSHSAILGGFFRLDHRGLAAVRALLSCPSDNPHTHLTLRWREEPHGNSPAGLQVWTDPPTPCVETGAEASWPGLEIAFREYGWVPDPADDHKSATPMREQAEPWVSLRYTLALLSELHRPLCNTNGMFCVVRKSSLAPPRRKL